VTQQFLQDTGSKNSSDLLPYTPSTEVAGIRGNFSGVANTGTYQENTISNTTACAVWTLLTTLATTS